MPDDEDRCPDCGGPLLYSHGVKRCPNREHEPYAEEVNHPTMDDELDDTEGDAQGGTTSR